MISALRIVGLGVASTERSLKSAPASHARVTSEERAARA